MVNHEKKESSKYRRQNFHKLILIFCLTHILVNKLSKHLMRGGCEYRIKVYIYKVFCYLKFIIGINPLMLYFYVIYFFLILINFNKRQKGGETYKIPENILEFDVFLLRTLRLFSQDVKMKWD